MGKLKDVIFEIEQEILNSDNSVSLEDIADKHGVTVEFVEQVFEVLDEEVKGILTKVEPWAEDF